MIEGIRLILKALFKDRNQVWKTEGIVYRVRHKETLQWSQGGDLRIKSNWTQGFMQYGGKFWTETRTLNAHLKANKEMLDKIEVVTFGCMEIDSHEGVKTLREEAEEKKLRIKDRLRRDGWRPLRAPIPGTKTDRLDFDYWTKRGRRDSVWWMAALRSKLVTREEIRRIKEYL